MFSSRVGGASPRFRSFSTALMTLLVICGYSIPVAQAQRTSIKGWGYNYYGQVGDGTITDRFSPVSLSGLNDVVSFSGGAFHTLALRSDRTVLAWGFNYYGQLGNGTRTTTGCTCNPTPALVNGLTDAIAVSGGGAHSLALKSDGTVWAWGLHNVGQLGTYVGSDYGLTPVRVNITDVIAIDAGFFHNLALKSDGTVWAWGYNNYGQLGIGTSGGYVVTPIQVSTLSNVVALAAGEDSSVSLKADGTVWAWGDNFFGQVGNGIRTIDGCSCITAPTETSISNVVQIGAGAKHNLALRSDGTVWAWGFNGQGQAGDGTGGDFKLTPVQSNILTSVTMISTSGFHNLARRSDGTVWAWGWNISGQVGTELGSYEVLTPTQLSRMSRQTVIGAGRFHSFAARPVVGLISKPE